MRGIGQPHDRFFKAVMSQPGVAEALLRERLPPAIAEKLVPGEPQRVAGSFVDEELRVALADRLFQVAAASPLPPSLLCLVEHKAAQQRRQPLQSLRYMTRIWARVGRDAGGAGRLPPILPLVVYHGREPWRVPSHFLGLVEGGDLLQAHLLDFPYTVIDLGQIDDSQLSADPTLRAGLMALKYATRPEEQRENLEPVLLALTATSDEFQRTGVIYILETWQVEREAVIEAVLRIMPAGERIVRTPAEQWRDEGRQEGEQKGKASMLQKQLERRFGALPQERVTQLLAADAARLDEWGERVIDAPDLGAVFADQPGDR